MTDLNNNNNNKYEDKSVFLLIFVNYNPLLTDFLSLAQNPDTHSTPVFIRAFNSMFEILLVINNKNKAEQKKTKYEKSWESIIYH